MDAVKVGVTGTGLIADLGHLPDYQAGADGRYRYSCAGLYPVSRGQSAADLGGGPGEQKFGARAVEEGVWQSSDLRHGRVFDVEDLAFAWIRLDNGLVMTFETAWTANLARDRVYSNLLRTKAGRRLIRILRFLSERARLRWRPWRCLLRRLWSRSCIVVSR